MTEFVDKQQHKLGNYKLLRLLGQGRHTEVYLGEHIHLKTQASIKVFHEDLSEDERGSRLAGLRRIAALRHPHIARMLEFGSDNKQFLVSEYASHGSLRQRYGPGEQLSPSIVITYVEAIAAALQYVHERGLVHGAIKPENMLLGRDDRILLADFRALPFSPDSESSSPVVPERVEASAYLAPEQWQGIYGPASDQYALAVVVYEWLSGAPPFQGTPTALRELHRHAPPPPLLAATEQIPHAVEQVLNKALAKDPAQRFASIAAFALALARAVNKNISPEEGATRILPQIPVLSHTAEVRQATSHAIEKTVPQSSVWEQVPVRRSRMRRLTIALGSLLVLFLAGGGLFIFQGGMLRSSQSGKLTPAEEATLSAMSPQDLYTFATSGQPVIDDHLDQPQNSQWRDEQKNQGKSSCTFRTVSGTTAYHLTVQHGAPPAVCFARNGNFSNFAFQISVRESLNDYQNDSQSAVGIAFCANNTGNTFKLFSAATFSGYSFIHYQAGNANLVTSGIPSVPILTPGSNDQLTVVAHNGHFAFYLNGHFIVSQNEAACSGSIGIFTGAPMNTSSEFVFSDARVWQL